MKLLYSLLRIIRTALITIAACLILFVVVFIGVVLFLSSNDTGIKADARHKIIWLKDLPGISPFVLADQGRTYKVFEPLWYDSLTGETLFYSKVLSTNNFKTLSYTFKGNAKNLESFRNEILYVNKGKLGKEMVFDGVKDGAIGMKDGFKNLLLHPLKSTKDIGGLILNGSKYIYRNAKNPENIKSDAIRFGDEVYRKTYIEVCNNNAIDSGYLITDEAKQVANDQATLKLSGRGGFEVAAVAAPVLIGPALGIKAATAAGEITEVAAIADDSSRVAKAIGSTIEITQNAQKGTLLERLTYTKSYGELAKELAGSLLQANHLNQDAAFGSIIPREEGVAVGMRGNALKDIGSPHFEYHKSLETFWDEYRNGGSEAGKVPSCAEYNLAIRKALMDAGYSEKDANSLVNAAAEQQVRFGLKETSPVPRIPGRMNQAQ
jgi:hypothetical protein